MNAKTIVSGIWRLGRGTATIMGLAMLLALTVGLASTALAGTGIGARFDLGKINTVNNATTQLVGSVAGSMLSITNQHPGERVCVDFGERLAARSAPGGPPTSPGPGGPPPPPPQQCFNNPAPALGLTVQPGQNPITVNSEAGTAKNLSADELDGRSSSSFANGTNGVANNANLLDGKDSTAFFFGKTYTEVRQIFGPGSAFEGKPFSVHAFCDPGDIALGGGGTDITFQTGDRLVATKPHQSDPRGWTTQFVDVNNGGEFSTTVRCADFPPLR